MKLTRRGFNKLALTAAAWPWLSKAAAAAPTGIARTVNWNENWRFMLGGPADAKAEVAAAGFDDRAWSRVTLPHWGHLESYDASQTYQGICWYRKSLQIDEGLRGRKVWFMCEGAMQVTDVWVDGVHRLRHAGGYLPFGVDITDDLRKRGSVEIALCLDSRDNALVPPGKPLAQLDFCYFSGMYRDVYLRVSDALYITDPVLANTVAGGGVFVRFAEVSARRAVLDVATDIRNERLVTADVHVLATLLDGQGRVVARAESPEQIASGCSVSVAQRLEVAFPALWSPEAPNLHTLVVRLMSEGRLVDEVRQRVGIRWLETDPRLGFSLNGRRRVPCGANRHQAYPYIGNALSDQAQYREARKLKAAGFDLIRLSHYPQSPAFLDACDELGMMVVECLPGWQFFDDSKTFESRVERDLRQLIRRDRNHACAALWETTLNETYGHNDFFIRMIEVAGEEYPGSQMLTCGDAEGHSPALIGRYSVPYSGWDDVTHMRPSLDHGAKSFHREYGDNQFGGYSRYDRGSGEFLMLVQAWNYQTALNQQMQWPWTWGQCTWEAIDNNRGMSTEIATCGAMDLFRLPKFLYHFFRSQRDPCVRSALFESGPMVYIANYWTSGSLHDVVVFSNADEVALLVNGHELSRQRPDDGPDVPFGDGSGFDLNYWTRHAGVPRDERAKHVDFPIYGGGNARGLRHPPFTFKNVTFMSGELMAVAYLDGKPVARHVRRTPGKPATLALTVDLDGVAFRANGADVAFVHAAVVDENGTTVPDASLPVSFEVDGQADLIGDNPRVAEAGIASILLRSRTLSGVIRLRAMAPSLVATELVLRSQRRD